MKNRKSFLLLLVLIGLMMTLPQTAFCWLTGWTYQREITLDTATPEGNFQVKVELTSTNFNYSHAAANGEDLRFTDTNENLQDYWVEEWNDTGTSIIWVEVATSGTSSFNMYYGNPLASSISNGDTTFDFFDDFNSGSYTKLFDVVAVEPQERYVNNPILQQGTAGSWEEKGIRDNALLTDEYGMPIIENGHYVMYYSGRDNSGVTGIGRATFERPTVSSISNMTKDSNNPVIDYSDMGWYSGRIFVGSVIKKDINDYIAYIFGYNGTGYYDIYYATSTDGISWTANTTPIVTGEQCGNRNLMLPNVRLIQYGVNAGQWVMYFEIAAEELGYATSIDGISWAVENDGNAIVTASSISWATLGPCNPKFLEVGENEYIMGINGNTGSPSWKGGFMKSNSLDSGWEDYGIIVLDAGVSGEWDDTRIESLELFADDFGNDLVGMMYFGCPSLDSFQDAAIGYTTIDQNAIQSLGSTPAGWTVNSLCTFETCSDGISGQGAEYNQTSTLSSGYATHDITPIISDNDRCFEVWIKPESGNSDTYYYIYFYNINEDNNYGPQVAFRNDGNISYKSSAGSWVSLQSWSPNNWYHFKFYNIDIANDQFDLDINGINQGTNFTFRYATDELSIVGAGASNGEPNTLVVSDRYIIRKYIDPEPGATVGEETTGEVTPPSNVTITISGDNVVLNWDWSGERTTYNVYRSTDPYSVDFTKINLSPIVETTYTDYGVAATETKYFYYITAE